MSLKKIILFITGFLFSQVGVSAPPVEIIDSCKNRVAANSLVIMTALSTPEGLGDDEPGCMEHYESTINNFNYGYITCNNKTSLIIKGSRISLDASENHSINPAITPEGDILPQSYWWKIEYKNNSYLCINTPLSSSGTGGNILQNYIVENAFNSNTPNIYFYFFNKDVTPISAL